MQNTITPITAEELRHKLRRREPCILLDILDENSYRSIHLPGALHIDVHREIAFIAEVERRVPNKHEEIVVYGTNALGALSGKAANLLASAGYKKIRNFFGGVEAWAEAHLPLEGERVEEIKRKLLAP